MELKDCCDENGLVGVCNEKDIVELFVFLLHYPPRGSLWKNYKISEAMKTVVNIVNLIRGDNKVHRTEHSLNSWTIRKQNMLIFHCTVKCAG